MGKRYDQLDLDDRIEISRLHAAGKSRHEIAHLMGRNASTISRELRRNSFPRGEYMPASADRIALSRCRRASRIERLRPLRSYESIYRVIYRPRRRQVKFHRFLARAKATLFQAQPRTDPPPPVDPRAPASR